MKLSTKTLQGNFDSVQHLLLNWQPQPEPWPSRSLTPFLSALSPFFCRPFLSSINWMWRDSQSSPSFIQHCLPLLLTINAIRIGSRAKIRTRRTQEKKLLPFLNEGRAFSEIFSDVRHMRNADAVKEITHWIFPHICAHRAHIACLLDVTRNC